MTTVFTNIYIPSPLSSAFAAFPGHRRTNARKKFTYHILHLLYEQFVRIISPSLIMLDNWRDSKSSVSPAGSPRTATRQDRYELASVRFDSLNFNS